MVQADKQENGWLFNIYDLSKFTQDDICNLNLHITPHGIETLIKNSPSKKTSGPVDEMQNYTRLSKS